MAFRFKRGRKVPLVSEFKRMDPRLQIIAHAMSSFCVEVFGKDLVITEIFRTEAQQRRYYPDQPYRMSVHQLGRGIDFGIRAYAERDLAPDRNGWNSPHPGLSANEILLLDEWYSNAVSYDDERPQFDSIIHHNVGLGDHLHVQVSWRKTTRLVSDAPTVSMLAERLGRTLPAR